MVRVLIDLPEDNLQRLKEIAEESQVSRTELMRQIVEKYLQEVPRSSCDVFGIWGDRHIDALEYEDDLRGPRTVPFTDYPPAVSHGPGPRLKPRP